MDFFDLAGFALGAAAAVLSVVAIVASLYAAKHAASLPVELAILSEFRSPRARSARGTVIALRPGSVADGGFESQTEEIRDAIRSVAHFYDHIGILISGGFVRKRTFVEFMGVSARQCWIASRAIVEAEREVRKNEQFLKYFQKFGKTRLSREFQTAVDRWLIEEFEKPDSDS